MVRESVVKRNTWMAVQLLPACPWWEQLHGEQAMARSEYWCVGVERSQQTAGHSLECDVQGMDLERSGVRMRS